MDIHYSWRWSHIYYKWIWYLLHVITWCRHCHWNSSSSRLVIYKLCQPDNFFVGCRHLRCLYIISNTLAPINVPNYASSVGNTIFFLWHMCVMFYLVACYSIACYCMYFCSNSYSVHCSTKALISYYASWCLFGATSLHSIDTSLLCCLLASYYYSPLYKSLLKNLYNSMYIDRRPDYFFFFKSH